MTDEQILNYLKRSDIIDLSTIEQEIEMREKKKYLDMHQYEVWQGKDGAWGTYLPDKERGRRLIKRTKKDDLEAIIIQYYQDEIDNPCFEEVFQKWVDEKYEYGDICKGTYDRYTNDFKRYFSSTKFRKYRIKLITENDIEIHIRTTIREKNLSRKAYSNMRTLIMGSFKYAKKHKYTEISITSFFKDLELSRKVFKYEPKDPSTQVYLEDEIPKVLQWLKDHPSPINLGIVLCFETGLRTGELAALKPEDIEGDVLHVQRQEIKYKLESGKQAHEVVEYTKTEAGNRYIYLPKSAINIIRQIRLMNPFGEYLIMENGKRALTTSFPYRLRKACAECNVPFKSMHKIRKTYGTTLIDNDVDDSLIMSQMGHANISTTREYYYYANKNSDHKREQIRNAINF